LLNFAVVIDDHLMKISHVLRGEEHLSNTAKQLVLYEALDWSPPQFGHLSLILNQEKKKLSKRDKETSQWQLVSQLREKGYLPTAVINYLLFLGWHPGTTQEFFSLSTAIASFGLTSLHARGAVFDLGKLNWYNNYYIQQLSLVEFGEHAWKIFWKEYQLSQAKKEWTIQIALLFRPQLNYFQELITLSWYFFQEPREEKINLDFSELRKISQLFSKIEQWTEENVKKSLTSIEKNFFSSIRKKITGENRGPELAKVIYLLGKEELIKRLEN